MKLYQILGVCLLMAALAVATKFKDCGSKGAKVDSITIIPCKSEPCTVNYHSKFRFHLQITPLENVTKPVFVPYVNVSGKLIPFKAKSGCTLLDCPIVAGRTLNMYFYVRFSYLIPNTSFDLNWIWLDDRGDTFFCVEIPFDMKNGLKLLKSRSFTKEPDSDFFGEIGQIESVSIHRIYKENM